MKIEGYRITVDGRALSHDLRPIVTGASVLSRDRVHELSLMPATYVLRVEREAATEIRLKVDANGNIALLDVPGGLIVMRPVPPPATLRSFYADFFLPTRGSASQFCASRQQPSLRKAIRDHREGLFQGESSRQNELDRIDNLFTGFT